MNNLTVIIPTLADKDRGASLKRAIHSIKTADKLRSTKILICVNGTRYDKDLLKELKSDAFIEIQIIAEASLPLALLHGRKCVRTEFFCFLDDDDEFTSESIVDRLNILKKHEEIDVVTSRGYLKDTLSHTVFETACFDEGLLQAPLNALFYSNWLSSCAGLYRTESIGIEFFLDIPKFNEWTWIAFKLGMKNKKVYFIKKSLFVINMNSPNSLSVSIHRDIKKIAADKYLLDRMLETDTRGVARKLIHQKLGKLYHEESNLFLLKNNFLNSLRAHYRSLLLPDGLRYIPYSRKILLLGIKKLLLPASRTYK